MLRRNKES